MLVATIRRKSTQLLQRAFHNEGELFFKCLALATNVYQHYVEEKQLRRKSRANTKNAMDEFTLSLGWLVVGQKPNFGIISEWMKCGE